MNREQPRNCETTKHENTKTRKHEKESEVCFVFSWFRG